MNCYNCSVVLNEENSSREHIINNSLGGRLKSNKLLCKNCNNIILKPLDDEIEKQLGNLADLLGIKKDRKKKDIRIPLKTKGGKTKYFGSNLRPNHRLIIEDNNGKKTEINVDGDKKFDSLIIAKQKENPKARYIEVVEQPPDELYYYGNTDKPGLVIFGGPVYFRAIAKMAVNFYLFKDYPIRYCKELITIIKGENKDIRCINYYYPTHYFPHTLKENETTHIIHLVGDKKNKILYAYIELFNFENFLIIFSMNYDESDFQETYCYDLRNNTEIEKDIKIKITRDQAEFLYSFSNSEPYQKEHGKKYSRFEKLIGQSQHIYK